MKPPSGWALGRLIFRPGDVPSDPLPFWGDQPWYLDELPPEMEQMLAFSGFPRERRAMLTPALKQLFSADECRRLVQHPWGRSAISGLYQTFIPYILPVLQLGLDLSIAQPWDDEKLTGRLLQQAEHRGASVELSAWAALAQAGNPYTFEREPKGRDESRPDFLVRAGEEAWFVEVKAANRSKADEYASEIEWDLQQYLTDLQADHKAVTVVGSDDLQGVLLDESRHRELPEIRERAMVALEACAKVLQGSNFAAGKYAATDLLTVHVEDSASPFVEFAIWDGLPPEKQAARLIRLIRDAAIQVPVDSRAIVLLDIGDFTRLDVFADEMDRAFREDEDRGRYAPIRSLIIFAYERDSEHRMACVPFQATLFGRELSPVELDLCRRLARQSLVLPV